MRKLLLFLIAGAMLGVGLYLIALEVWFARSIYFRFAIWGCLLALFGGYLIWTDFIAPRFGIKTWEDR
jgi:hypothetical protein